MEGTIKNFSFFSMKWIEALKIYNTGRSWCVPKKGTPEHAEVKAIMRGEKPGVSDVKAKAKKEVEDLIKSIEAKHKKPETKPKPKKALKIREGKEIDIDKLGQSMERKKKERVAKFLLALAKKKKESKKTSILRRLETVVAEMEEVSKEGKTYRMRENWKGKASYLRKIDELWTEYLRSKEGGADKFYGKIPLWVGWKPKTESDTSHAFKMYEKHGTNID